MADTSDGMQGADATPVYLQPDAPEQVKFYKLQDGTKGRDIQSGAYLDYVQDYAAEVNRAAIEGRDVPDFGDVVPASVGTVLVPKPYLFDNSVASNPSMALSDSEADEMFEGNVDRTGTANQSNAPYDPSTGTVAPVGDNAPQDASDDSASVSPTKATPTPRKATA
jgi:hypothetical protein